MLISKRPVVPPVLGLGAWGFNITLNVDKVAGFGLGL